MERTLVSRTGFHLDCRPTFPACGFTCAKCIEEMESVFAGTPGVGRFYREGSGIVVEYDAGVVTIEQLLSLFRKLPSFYPNHSVPSVMEHPGGRTDAGIGRIRRMRSIISRGWGAVSVRRMFGGAGLYRAGAMFAVIADDVAYLKVDDSDCDAFLQGGRRRSSLTPDKIKTAIGTYYEIPADILEEPAALPQWAERSWIIAEKNRRA